MPILNGNEFSDSLMLKRRNWIYSIQGGRSLKVKKRLKIKQRLVVSFIFKLKEGEREGTFPFKVLVSIAYSNLGGLDLIPFQFKSLHTNLEEFDKFRMTTIGFGRAFSFLPIGSALSAFFREEILIISRTL